MHPSVHPVGLTALFTQLYIAVSITVQPILHNRITSSKKLRDCHFNSLGRQTRFWKPVKILVSCCGDQTSKCNLNLMTIWRNVGLKQYFSLALELFAFYLFPIREGVCSFDHR